MLGTVQCEAESNYHFRGGSTCLPIDVKLSICMSNQFLNKKIAFNVYIDAMYNIEFKLAVVNNFFVVCFKYICF